MNTTIIQLKNGDYCKVITGTHKRKQGLVQDEHTSKTGQISITVKQDNGIRFKTLAKSVEMISS
ncbi:MAG: hypothetical protein ACOVNY_07935 [Chitinophagaceae bacterium]